VRAALTGLALACLAGGAGPVRAQPQAGDEPVVELDRLLKLPAGLEMDTHTRGGSSKAQWRTRYDEARRAVAEAEKALDATRAKLEDVAGESSAWKMGAPGLGNVETSSPSEGPLDYQLSTEMRRNREELERAKRQLAELDVEANLAGVPEDWRGSQPPPAAEGAEPAGDQPAGSVAE
jgi:hypothetical protein